MKSQQRGNIIDTSCKNCILAVYDGKTQTGCIANRISKFDSVIEAYDDDKEFYVINRLCNYYRDSDEYIKDGVPDIEKISYESQLSFDVIIQCDDIDEKYENKIRTFYSNLNHYDKSKINTHLCFTTLNNKQKKTVQHLREDIGNPPISYFNNYIFLHNMLSSTTRSYHIILSNANEWSLDSINQVNNKVNTDMKKLIAIKDGDVSIISNLAYKVESYKLESNNYSKIVSKVISDSKEMGLYTEL